MKKQVIWFVIFALVSILIIGVATNFKFDYFDIQFHDTYYVIGSRDGIEFLTAAFVIGRNFYLLIDLISDKYKILALFVSIINAIAGLLLSIITYVMIENKPIFPGANASGYFLVLVIFIVILLLQILIEIKMIMKLRGVWAKW